MTATVGPVPSRKPAPRRAAPSPELVALRRAARAARRLAEATGTPFYVWRRGKVVDLNARPGRSRRRPPRSQGTSR